MIFSRLFIEIKIYSLYDALENLNHIRQKVSSLLHPTSLLEMAAKPSLCLVKPLRRVGKRAPTPDAFESSEKRSTPEQLISSSIRNHRLAQDSIYLRRTLDEIAYKPRRPTPTRTRVLGERSST